MKTNHTSLSLESVCEYAYTVTDDREASAISTMLMHQYMSQGLSDPTLSALILGIPERRKQIRYQDEHPDYRPQDALRFDHLPPKLRTPQAIEIWKLLYAEALVDGECQTLCSRTESGLMAAAIAKALGIREVWKTFEDLWDMRNLKSARDKALDYQSGWNFNDKIDKIIPSSPNH